MKLYLILLTLLAVLVVPAIAEIPEILPDPDTTPPDTTRPVKVFILSGQSNMVGEGRIGPLGTLGTLETITKTDGMFPYLVNDDTGAWNVRNDVWYRGLVTAIGDGLMKPGVMGSKFGPELGFGNVMGYYYDEPVIVIKSSQGNRGIGWDYAPPSTPRFDYNGYTYAAYGESPNRWTIGTGPSPFVWYAGKQWDDCFMDELDMSPPAWTNATDYSVNVKNMQYQVKHNGQIYLSKVLHISSPASEPGVGSEWNNYWSTYSINNVTDVLDNFATEYPEYADQGFEIVGYGWWQGNWEMNAGEPYVGRYEFNMVNLIKDMRQYYENRYPNNTKTDAPFVIATYAENGWAQSGNGLAVANAQLAVSGETGNYPEFEGNVKTVECRDYWRESSISPTTAGYHYNGNAETFMLVGEAMGRAMAELMTPYSVKAGKNMVTWNGQSINLDATVQEGITVTSYSWTAIPDDGVVFDSNTIEDPTVTITKPAGDMATVILKLTVNDGVNKPATDTIRVDVYDDACQATRLGLGITNKMDLHADCVINLADLAVMANKWLDDKSLTESVPKLE